jgi:tRNA pseudouridine38-40 synthase
MQLALGVEYHGAAFNGYQQQRDAPSVQQALQQALSQVADHPVVVRAAGRTDSGVHATGQVVAFQTNAQRPLHSWLKGTNSLTPGSLSVNWVIQVDEAFHPRYSAVSRRYQYLFYESAVRSPLLDGVAVQSRPLDDAAMHRAAQRLLGERDFTTFRGAGCQSRTPFRRLDRISVHRSQSLVFLDIQANAFLLHMVRNIAGALWQIGLGSRSADWLDEILLARDRALAGPTAPAHGLYLVQVTYPGYPFPTPQLPGVLRALGALDRFS